MPIVVGQDTARTRKSLKVGSKTFAYYSIPAAEAAGLGEFANLPAALKVVLENMLRVEDGKTVSVDDIKAFYEGKVARWCVPDDVRFVDDLPHTATGKLRKTDIRKLV